MNKCDLCQREAQLKDFDVAADKQVEICNICEMQIKQMTEPNYFRFLSDAMWSEKQAVQLLSYILLGKINETWAMDLRDQMYLGESLLSLIPEQEVIHLDSNGAKLEAGDTVTLIKDLVVKGGNFTAKRGTTVKSIRLTDDPLYIEGKVEGQMIVIVSNFVKKAK